MSINKNTSSIPLNESMLSIASIREADPVVHRQLIGGNENQRSEFLKGVSKNYYSQVMTTLQSIWDKYNQTKNIPELSEALNQFLKSPWLPPMYTAFPENPATKLLTEVAFNLAKQDKSSALDKLFNKNIQKETHRNHYDDLSDSSVEDILHILKTHVLWDNYLIPVKVLAEKRNDPDSLWHKDGLYNPYFTDFNNLIATKNYLYIPPAIYQRIIQHSDATRQIHDYQEAYAKTQEDAGSLLGQLTLLGKRFASNDAHTGIGKPEQAGIGAAIAFIQFYNDFYEHISTTQKATIPEELRNEIELIKNLLSQTKYTLALISSLPNNNPQNAKPKTIYLAEDGRYILKNMTGIVVEGVLSTRQVSLENLDEELYNDELLNNILSYLAQNGGHTPTAEQINTNQISTCVGTRGNRLRSLTTQNQTLLSAITLDTQHKAGCITAAQSDLDKALTELNNDLENGNYQGHDALIITPDLLDRLNITIDFNTDAKLALLDPLTTDECDLLFTQKPGLIHQIRQLLAYSKHRHIASIEKLVWFITGMPIAPLNSLLAHLKKPLDTSSFITFTSTSDIIALLITLTPEKLAIVCQHCINWTRVTEDDLFNIASSLTPEQNNVFNLSILSHTIKSYDGLLQFIKKNPQFSLSIIKNHLASNPPEFMTKTTLRQWLNTQDLNEYYLDDNKALVKTILCLPSYLQEKSIPDQQVSRYYSKILDFSSNYTDIPNPSAELMLELTTAISQGKFHISYIATKYKESNLFNHYLYSLYSNSTENRENKVKAVYAHIKKFYENSISKPVTDIEYKIMIMYSNIVYYYGITPNLDQYNIGKIIESFGTSEHDLTRIQNVTQNTYFTNLIRAQIKKEQAISFRAELFETLKIPYLLMILENAYLIVQKTLAALIYILIFVGTPVILMSTVMIIFNSIIFATIGFNIIALNLGAAAGAFLGKFIDLYCNISPAAASIYNEYIFTSIWERPTIAERSAANIAAASIDYIPAIDVFDYVPTF